MLYIPDVELHEADSLDQVAVLMARYGPDARVLAGGTDLLVDLKTGRLRTTHLVSINRLSSLAGVTRDDRGLRIGALTTITQLAASPLVSGRFAPILDAAREMAAPQVRNLATVGGNIASAVPCADLPPILMVMHASVETWSPSGTRETPLNTFFVGPRKTALPPGELVVAIRVPPPPAGSGAAYCRLALRDGNAIAVAGVAAGLQLETPQTEPAKSTPPTALPTPAPPVGNQYNTISDALIALGAVAPTPVLVKSAATILCGRAPDDDAFALAADAAVRAAAPISDVRGSAEYRREMVGVLTRRALATALRRATG